MKTHRRVEITAFRRKVTIVSGEFEAYADPAESYVEEPSLETISPDSNEGRRILSDAIRLLEQQLADSERD